MNRPGYVCFVWCMVAALAAICAAPVAWSSVILSNDGKVSATILVAPSPTDAETTAVQELAAYLSKITGGTHAVELESQTPSPGAHVYVGATAFAREHGVDSATMGPEEWVVRSVGDNLILTGGRPRGTLYAVYRFLEEVIGVHWWNACEENVPQKPTLEVDDFDLHGKPCFRYRDIYMLYANDNGRFAARNRINRQGDAPIAGEFGGEMSYGPPAHVHTFYTYMPPAQYFAEHPEWFSLIDGKRSADQAQLCLTNPELRKAFLEKLKAYIESSHAEAGREGKPAPLVFDVSQNDCGGMCQCDACQAIAKAEDSEAGPLLDFVNFLADAVKESHPEVFIDTLAYMMTQRPSKTIRPRDNVIIRLCDTGSNFTKPITDNENRRFRDELVSWSDIAKNLRIWDYAVTYAPHYGFPMPTVHTYPIDYRFYAEHNVEGVFTEHEYPILADLRDFKIWMMMKMLEDPYRDYPALVKTFMDGFYGAASPHISRYLSDLESAAVKKSSYLSMGGSPSQCRYLDVKFVMDAMRTFDEAEQAAADDPAFLRRVRHARLPLDRATVVRFRDLMIEWTSAGHNPEELPLDRDAIAARYKNAWYEQVDLRIPPGARDGGRAEADAEVAALTDRPAYVPLPEKFRDLPVDAAFDFPAYTTRNWNDEAKRVPDSEAESGFTNRFEIPDDQAAKYGLPMPWGLYDQVKKSSGGSAAIQPADVPGTGYHWYKMGAFPIGPSYYLYFFWSWIIQVDLGNLHDPTQPDQKFDVWARIRFEGPLFPHGKAEDKNAICIERVVLLKEQP